MSKSEDFLWEGAIMAGPAPTEGIVLATRHQNQCGVAFRIVALFTGRRNQVKNHP